MSLTLFPRNGFWWVRGRADGIDGYIRRSLGTSDEAVAKAKVAAIEAQGRKRAILGDEAPDPKRDMTFAAAVMLYDAKPAEAKALIPIVKAIGKRRISDLTPSQIKALARKLYPNYSTDSWRRWVLTPVQAVLNNTIEDELAPKYSIPGFTASERIEQDRRRGKQSRQPKTPGSWEWLLAFRDASTSPYRAALAGFMFTTGARITQSVLIEPAFRDLPNGRIWLPAAKGHPAQWVDLDPMTIADLANLKPRRGRVFGFQHRWSVYKGWKADCARAGIDYLPPHSCGRHGFGTEMVVRQGIDPVSAAEFGRWSSPELLLKTYAHSDDAKAKIRAAFRTGLVHATKQDGVSELKKKGKS